MTLLEYEWMLRDMVFACGDKCLLRLGHSPAGATTASITESESDDAHRFLKETSLHLIFKKSKKKRSENYTNQFYGSIYTQQKSGGAISISYTSKMPQTFLP